MTFNNTTIPNEIYTMATGAASSNPFVVTFHTIDPTIYDIQYPIQKVWLNTTTETFWFLKNFNTSQGITTAHWITFGSSSLIEKILVDTFTAPGTNPVVPDASGQITVTGGQIAAGSTANVIRTDSLAPNTFTVEVQRSQAVASSTVGDNGVSHFDSESFSVDSNGFVQLLGGGFTWIDINGPFVAAKNTGYFVNASAEATLPPAPVQGDTIKFFVETSSPQFLMIAASGTQFIRIGSLITLAGGSATNTLQGDSLELVYRAADTCWCSVAGNTGTWTII